MPTPALVEQFKAARRRHDAAVAELIPLLPRMAFETVKDALPTANVLEVLGEMNEDWAYTLRTQRVLDARGEVLWEIGTGDDSTTDAISTADMDYLDDLLDMTGEDYLGRSTIERADLVISLS